jgi:hypothetical protein
VSFREFRDSQLPPKRLVQQRLEEMLRLALGFALLGANLGSVQACVVQEAEQGGSPKILLIDVIQSLPKGLLPRSRRSSASLRSCPTVR